MYINNIIAHTLNSCLGIFNTTRKVCVIVEDKKDLGKEIRQTSEEVGEDSTKYGEFISSYFAWVSLPNQKEKAQELENITKNKDK